MPLVEMKHCEINKNGFSQADKQEFLKLFEQHRCDVVKVCDLIGISPKTYYEHVDHDEAFGLHIRILKRNLAWSLVPRQVERAQASSPTDAIWLQKNLAPTDFQADRPSVIGGDRVVILQVTGAGLRESSTTSDVVDPVRPPPRQLSSEDARHMQRQSSERRRTMQRHHRRQLAYQQKWRAKNPNYHREWQARRKARLLEKENQQSVVDKLQMSDNRQTVNTRAVS